MLEVFGVVLVVTMVALRRPICFEFICGGCVESEGRWCRKRVHGGILGMWRENGLYILEGGRCKTQLKI